MSSRVDFSGGGQSGASTVDAGSVFGVDSAVANAPVLLERGGQPINQGNWPGEHASWVPKSTPTKMGTVLSSVAGFYQLDQGEQAQLVDQMEAAGYLDPVGKGKRRRPQDVNSAWRAVVLDAARSGKTIPEVLQDASGVAGGSDASAAPTIALSNTEDLRAVFREVFTKKLGMGPDNATLDKMVAAYHQKEIGSATAAQAGGAVESAPSPGTFAGDYAKQTQPVRYGARGAVKVASVVEQMLGGSMPSTSQQMPAAG